MQRCCDLEAALCLCWEADSGMYCVRPKVYSSAATAAQRTGRAKTPACSRAWEWLAVAWDHRLANAAIFSSLCRRAQGYSLLMVMPLPMDQT